MTGAPPHDLRPAERLVAFTDAVVAIAMTLLILPLLESVKDAAARGTDTVGYLQEDAGQLFAFALSFFIIATFWRGHSRLFEHVERHDAALLRLNVGWMFTIVWLPVATAMVGAMETDRVQVALYIGTMLATSLLTLAMWLLVLRRPHLQRPDRALTDRAVLPAGVASALFAVALLLGLVVPGAAYWALLVLLLNPPIDLLLARLRPRPGPPR